MHVLYTVVGTVIGTVIATALVSEGGACLTRLNRRVVRRVLSQFPEQLPGHLRCRWSEEIEADLESYSKQPLRGLWFALTLRRRGARRLAAELLLEVALSLPAVQGSGAAFDPRAERDHNHASDMGWLENAYARELRERLGYDRFEGRHERRLEK